MFDYLSEEKKISTLSKEWLAADSNFIQVQARAALIEVKKTKRGKWFKQVLICTTPNTWREVVCEEGEPGAYQYK